MHAAELADASTSASEALAAPTMSDRLTPVARRLRGEALAVAAAFRVLAQPSVTPAEVRAAQAAFARAAAVTGRLGDT